MGCGSSKSVKAVSPTASKSNLKTQVDHQTSSTSNAKQDNQNVTSKNNRSKSNSSIKSATKEPTITSRSPSKTSVKAAAKETTNVNSETTRSLSKSSLKPITTEPSGTGVTAKTSRSQSKASLKAVAKEPSDVNSNSSRSQSKASLKAVAKEPSDVNSNSSKSQSKSSLKAVAKQPSDVNSNSSRSQSKSSLKAVAKEPSDVNPKASRSQSKASLKSIAKETSDVISNTNRFALTKKEIANRNGTNRTEAVLVPISGKIYDVKQMYNIIEPEVQNLEPRNFDIEDEYKRIRRQMSSYLGLVGTCKFIGIKENILDGAKRKSYVGDVRELSIDEKQQDFNKDICLTLASLSGDDEYIWDYDFGRNCQKMANMKLSFEDKVFKPISGYQNDVEFPLSTWWTSDDLRSYLKPQFRRKDEQSKEEKIEYAKECIQLVLEGYKSDKKDMTDLENQNEAYKLLMDYVEVLMQGLRWQLDNCTLFEEVKFQNKDTNKDLFVLPSYIQVKDLRLFLETFVQFDLTLPDDGYAWDHIKPEDCNLYKDKLEEMHSYFAETLASDRISACDTEVENAVAWTEAEVDVIKNDVLTEAQKECIKSREKRTDLYDEASRKERRNKLLKKYGITDEKYLNWYATLEKSFQDFADVCAGVKKPCIREPVDKKLFAEERYQFIISQVKPIDQESKQKMFERRMVMLKGFISRHELPSESVLDRYTKWADRLEENARILLELCERNEEIRQEIKNRKGQNIFQVLFVPYDTFGERK